MGVEEKAIITPGAPEWGELIKRLGFNLPKKLIAEAPRYDLTPREVHIARRGYYGGYHAHTLYRRGSTFKRSGHLITLYDSIFYIQEHGCSGNALFDVKRVMNSLIDELGERLEFLFKNIPYEQLQLPAKEAIKMIDIETLSSRYIKIDNHQP
ncbi:MAG: hypothetical protein NT001_05295 [Candidatus Woesearchaeota archaeon]|nr:hypothetical protein [Candidatus Woesearchaeota archaeon]